MEYASWKLYPNRRRNSRTGAKTQSFDMDLKADHCSTDYRGERSPRGSSNYDGVKSRIQLGNDDES